MTKSLLTRPIKFSKQEWRQIEPHAKELPSRMVTLEVDQWPALNTLGMHTDPGECPPSIIGRQAAQQLAEADPAGWAIGWGAWPAGLRENRWAAARFRRAA